MRPHEKLEVWNRAIDFVVTIYKVTESFPGDEKFGLTSQVRRASVSVAANIAEGAARQSAKEFSHFVSMAQGSTSELETELLIAYRLNYINEVTYLKLREELNTIGRMTLGLLQHLKKRISQ